MLSTAASKGHSWDLWCWHTNKGKRQFVGRSTLSHSATSPYTPTPLLQTQVCAVRLTASGLSKQVVQTADWLWHMPLHTLCNHIQELSRLFDFAKEFAKLQEAFETAGLQTLLKNISVSCLLTKLNINNNNKKYRHCQPHTCQTWKKHDKFVWWICWVSSCPAIIKLPAVQEDYVPSCRLGLLDREREDGEISDLRLDTKCSNTR